jgi:lipid-A-disaccharide synthase
MSKKIYIIAGEDSGDNLGAKLITQLKELSGESLELYGVGGMKMAESGLKSLFPMREISLIGFVEIIPHLPNLLARIRQTVEDIKRIKPDVVITIDAPGFNKRVAKILKKEAPEIKRVHFVAPTVWAYKPKRAKKMADLFHHLLVLLPFEPPYFEAENLPTTFTGHPVFEDFKTYTAEEKLEIRKRFSLEPAAPFISLLVGSRAGEVKKLLPVYIDTIALIKKEIPNAKFAFLVTGNHVSTIRERVANLADVQVVSGELDKKQLLQVSNAALVKSGTISLEVAAAAVPMVITYKVSPLSAFMLRRMIKVKYVTLVNIIKDSPIIPELLQEDAKAELLSKEVIKLLQSSDVAQNQVSQAEEALKAMGFRQSKKPSKIAAETILKLINS